MEKKLFSNESTQLPNHEMGGLLKFSRSKISRKFPKTRQPLGATPFGASGPKTVLNAGKCPIIICVMHCALM